MRAPMCVRVCVPACMRAGVCVLVVFDSGRVRKKWVGLGGIGGGCGRGEGDSSRGREARNSERWKHGGGGGDRGSWGPTRSMLE